MDKKLSKSDDVRHKNLNRAGRKAGIPNKVTQEFRVTVKNLLEDNAENVALWLGQVAQDDPKGALDMLTKLAEFASPKLARSELVGDKDNPLTVQLIQF